MEYLSQEQIQAMPVADRLDLIEKLWLSIENDPVSFPLTDAQKQLIDERLADAGNAPNDTWDEIESRVLRRLREFSGA